MDYKISISTYKKHINRLLTCKDVNETLMSFLILYTQ